MTTSWNISAEEV